MARVDDGSRLPLLASASGEHDALYGHKAAPPRAGGTFEGFSKGRITLVVINIVIYIGFWIAESELVQGLQEPGSKVYYPKPFFVNWFIRAGYALFIPFWAIMRVVATLSERRKARIEMRNFDFDGSLWIPITEREKKVLKNVWWLELIFFISGYAWYYSLARTSVSANTIIFDMMPVFVLPFGIWILGDRASVSKLCAIVICSGGMMAVALSSQGQNISGEQKQTWDGYAAITFSMISYAYFEVMFAKYVSDDPHGHSKTHTDSINDAESAPANSAAPSPAPHEVSKPVDLYGVANLLLFVGCMGVIDALLLWWGIPLLNAIHINGEPWEKFEMPPTPVVELLLLNIFLDATMNMIMLFIVLLTTPLFMSVASLLGIPVALIYDWLFNHELLRPWSWVGLFMVLGGFALFTAEPIVQNCFCWIPRKRRDEIVAATTCGGKLDWF